MKGTCSLTGFLKNSHLGKWAIVSLKSAHRHNSGPSGRIFLKFCTIKGANSLMKIILIIFQKILFSTVAYSVKEVGQI